MTVTNIAIAGDLHGAWDERDHELLMHIKPDAILFVGDLLDGDLRVIKSIRRISIPCAVILGNHDRGSDQLGQELKQHFSLLGDFECSWKLRNWENIEISVVGGRPCSPGGGYFLTEQMRSVFGSVSIEESAARIVNSAKAASIDLPLVLLAHSGPTGLGSELASLCSRDWKSPSIDWGDKDLDLAIHSIRKERPIDLVVFGHMHHQLKRGKGQRKTFFMDCNGTAFLNAACVPRKGLDEHGDYLSHLSWVQFDNRVLKHISHRWFRSNGSVAYQENLYQLN